MKKIIIILIMIVLSLTLVSSSLIPSTDPLYDYEYNGQYNAYFKVNPTQGQVIKFESRNIEYTLQPMALNYRNDLGQIQQIEMINSVVGSEVDGKFVYGNAYGNGINLTYTFYGTYMKEELVINSYNDLQQPQQYIIDGGNPTLDLDFIFSSNSRIIIGNEEWDRKNTLITTEEVYIQNQQGENIYYFPKPYAYDSNETGPIEPLTYQFTKRGNNLYIILKTPYEWLNDVSRVYPVYLDPSSSLLTDITAYWALEDNGENNTVQDSTGNGNDGARTAALVNQTGIIDNSFNFGPSDSYFTMSISIPSNDFSINFWADTVSGAYYGTIADLGNLLISHDVGDKIAINREGSGGIAATNLLTDGSFSMITVTQNTTHLSIYYNGTLDSQHTPISFTPGTTFIAKYQGGQQFKGDLDEIGIWSKTLTQSEITDLYNGGAGKTYPFPPDVAPSIDQDTYNMTNAVTNGTAWRTNTLQSIKTRFFTPTVTFSTDINALCRINTVDQNWTTMGNDRNCTTTGSTAHTCTLFDGDKYIVDSEFNELYLGCIDATMSFENVTSTSGTLNVSVDLWSIQGYVLDASSTGIEDASVFMVNQQDDVVYDTQTTNSTGKYAGTVYGGNWTVYAYLNNTVDPSIKSFVVVP